MKLTLEQIGANAKKAETTLRTLSAIQKNKALATAADYLIANMKMLLEANHSDVERAKENGMAPGLVDRLLLTEARIAQMADCGAGSPDWGSAVHEAAAKRAVNWAETRAFGGDRHYLRVPAKCDGRCFRPVL